MDFLEAIHILDLPVNFTPENLKKNYRKLVMEYHPDKIRDPDKCKDPDNSDQIIKIQQAYEFLNTPHVNDLNNFFGKIFKTFAPIYKEIDISPKEYLTGTTVEVKIPTNCNCTQNLCKSCIGCGYSLNGFNLETCIDCLGNGTVKVCKCKLFKIINIVIPSKPNMDNLIITCNLKLKLKLNSSNYVFSKNKLYYTFDISLKESLIGFKKKFKDPFENEHIVVIKNTIIKQNDGYQINEDICLLFNIIYPELTTSLKKALTCLDF